MKIYKDKVFYDIEQTYERVAIIRAYTKDNSVKHAVDDVYYSYCLRMAMNGPFMDIHVLSLKGGKYYNVYHGYKHKVHVTNGHSYRKDYKPIEIQDLGPTYKNVNTGWKWII